MPHQAATEPSGRSTTSHTAEPLKQDAGTFALIHQLCGKLAHYLPEADVAQVREAAAYSTDAHRGQFRKSGEPYVHHPIHVAMAMAELHLDTTTIIAGILHDVVEDTAITCADLKTCFGPQIADIVNGVSKIDRLERRTNRKQAQAYNLQKMILATSQDMRVILVKLVDRLHNMRTLDAMSVRRQRRIALETLQIYAAIAHRLGMDKVRRELEKLGFRHLYPLRSRVIQDALERDRARCREVLSNMHASIRVALDDADIDYSIENRRKNAYSVYRKMTEKRRPFSMITDIFGFRLVVDTVDDCYRVLGILHNLYKPLPGKFKDYIALPKENGYQSLHTVLFGPQGICVEVQIRTCDMDTVAENGIAAHHRYKMGESVGSSALIKAREWVMNLMELRAQHPDDTVAFMESVKLDLFPNEVYVFTPQGDIYELPRGATALDFAFAVHTGLGLTCRSAQIEGQTCALASELSTGQTVRITTSPDARPSHDWLGFLVTAKARAAVRNYLKKMRSGDAAKLGRHLLELAMKRYDSTLDAVRDEQLVSLLKTYNMANEHELFHAIGLGKHVPHIVAAHLLEGRTPEDGAASVLDLSDASDLVVTYARCCYPLPGDKAVGVFKPDLGLVVHRAKCANITHGKHRAMGKLAVRWPVNEDDISEYHAAIRVEARHERGVLATIADKIATAGSNIEHIHFEGEGGPVARLFFVLGVRDRDHLKKVMRRIRNSFKDTRVSRVGQSAETETL